MKDLKKNIVIEPILLYAFYIKMKTEWHHIQLKKLTVLPQNSESSQTANKPKLQIGTKRNMFIYCLCIIF